MVDALPLKPWPDVTIVQMLGGLGPVDALEHSSALAQRIAQKFSARLRLLPAPGIVSTQPAAQALKSDNQITEMFEQIRDIPRVIGVAGGEGVLSRFTYHGTRNNTHSHERDRYV
jgi:DNA-binding transcriptional regulator LsrR (DeoR family)